LTQVGFTHISGNISTLVHIYAKFEWSISVSPSLCEPKVRVKGFLKLVMVQETIRCLKLFKKE